MVSLRKHNLLDNSVSRHGHGHDNAVAVADSRQLRLGSGLNLPRTKRPDSVLPLSWRTTR